MGLRAPFSLVAVLLTACMAHTAHATDGRVTALSGRVVITSDHDATHTLLAIGDTIPSGATVGGPDGAQLDVTFDDGTRVTSVGGMLLWIDDAEGATRLTLLYGEVQLRAGPTGAQLQLVDAAVELEPDTLVRAAGDRERTDRVDVLAGSADIRCPRGTMTAAEGMRAWPVGKGLPWAQDQLPRGRILPDTRPYDPPLPRRDPAPQCDRSSDSAPWIQCEDSGIGCICHDSRYGRRFYADPDRPTLVAGPREVADSDPATDSDKQSDAARDLPNDAADRAAGRPLAEGDPSGDAVVIGVDSRGRAVTWSGASATAVARDVSETSRHHVDAFAPASRGGWSSYGSHSSWSDPSPRAMDSYGSGSSWPSAGYQGVPAGASGSGTYAPSARVRKRR
jgi:hypothetical protein